MNKEKSPAYQRYPKDYLSDINVQMMTLEEEGAYNRLIDITWLEGSIPDDDEALSKACKNCSLDVIRVVKKCFTAHPTEPGKLVHPRLDKERIKQAEWSKKSSEGGKKSAESRRNKKKTNRDTQAKGGSKMVEPNVNSSFPSSSPSSDLKENNLKENFLQDECKKYAGKYEAKLIQAFLRHWTEKIQKGRNKGKQKWEIQETWETGKRLATWYENDQKWNRKNNAPTPGDQQVYQGSIQDKIRRQNEAE